MRKRIFTFLWAVVFLLSLTIFTTGGMVRAAGVNAVKSVTVRIGNKNVTKKTYTLAVGAGVRLKVTASPVKAVKSVRYISDNTRIASVNKNGKITAKQTGTAKISITVTGKNNRKMSTWVKVRVKKNKTASDGKKRVLVAYFSATNTTEKIAGYIADGLKADRYEIVPEVPYTSEDLDYNNSSSRTTMEMDDPDSCPAISGKVSDMGQYDVVFLGFPIWWSKAPRIINTFLESYDFSGKTIVPFCTSGSSGLGSSATELRSSAGSAQWLSGKRFSGNASGSTVMEWVNGLGLDI